MAQDKEHCGVCGKKAEIYELKKCPICHKMFCEDCTYLTSGIRFCSKFCSEFFFHGDSESEDS